MKPTCQTMTVPVRQIHAERVPQYPRFAPVSLALQREISHRLALAQDGISEYTFANLYLFRRRYHYQVSIDNAALILSGEHDGELFFMTPCGLPSRAVLEDLFLHHHTWKGIPESLLLPHREQLERRSINVSEDRDNWDYLYRRTDLAHLPGKKYRKKRNLVSAFLSAYAWEERTITNKTTPDALAVLDRWREDKDGDGDYQAAREGLELWEPLGLSGKVYYADGVPVGWCLGETTAQGRVYAVHFEKGIDAYRGVYQFVNQRFAASLPESVSYINREQDLGDEGLRQAKMTYRPCGFVRKYTATRR